MAAKIDVKKEVELGYSSHYSHQGFVTQERIVYLQHHRPSEVPELFHFHPSIEVNFLEDCEMTYSFSGTEFEIKRNHFTVFWAAYPHRCVGTNADEGVITNAYITLSEFLRWQLPAPFVNTLLSGAVLTAKNQEPGDRALAHKWAAEVDQIDEEWQKLHLAELHGRLRRMALQGWDVLHKPEYSTTTKIIGGNAVAQFEKMLRFVAENYASLISIEDVAKVGGVSVAYAISLFKKMLGRTIKEHITDMRIAHARMLLTETDAKILTIAMEVGFGSLSAFYESFSSRTGYSPAAYRKEALSAR